jgi:CBS domain containing-hemolysin-like protein
MCSTAAGVLREEALMTQRTKTIVFLSSTLLILFNVLAAYLWRQYPPEIWVIISLVLLVVSFAFVLLALLHGIKGKKFPEQLIRAGLALIAMLVYPVFYAVLGFIAIGMAHD